MSPTRERTSGPPGSWTPATRALPDVGAVEGSVNDIAKIVGRDGKTVVTHGAPALAFSVDPHDQRFNPLTLVSGSWPTTATSEMRPSAS